MIFKSILVAFLILIFYSSTPSKSQNRSEDPVLALVGGTIYTSPFEKPINNGCVIIKGNKIVSVTEGIQNTKHKWVKKIDCRGYFILAGFWNCHVHFFERKWGNAENISDQDLNRQLSNTFLRYGFTTVYDLGSQLSNTRIIQKRIEGSKINGPRILTTGEPIIAKGAMPSSSILGLLGYMSFPVPEVENKALAMDIIKTHISQNVDGIKVILQTPPRPNPAIDHKWLPDLVNYSHRFSKPFFVHPTNAEDVLASISSGVDVIAHTTPLSSWSPEIFKSPNLANTALTPTLTLWNNVYQHDNISLRDSVIQNAIDQVSQWTKNGGKVIFGTDLAAVPPDPGLEYELMSKANLNYKEIIATLTSEPAKVFGESEFRGSIKSGSIADVTILRGDPKDQISNLKNVVYVIKDGKIIYSDIY